MDPLTLALAQVNPTVGDFPGNVALVLDARRRAAAAGADLAVFPELVVTGYPPEDLIARPAFVEAAARAVDELAAATGDGGPALVVGAPVAAEGEGGGVHNAALFLDGGEVRAVRRKHHLPNYGVFDERRVFVPGPPAGPVRFRDVNLGIMVCEDMWHADIAETLAESGAHLLVVINGSPFDARKADARLALAVARVNETDLPLVYVNQTGGQDELVFDGASFALAADARLAAQAPSWEDSVLCTTWRPDGDSLVPGTAEIHAAPEGEEAVWRAMATGLRDYVAKNRFPGVVLGLSGGIDSALSAAVAVDALGPERVRGVRMPSSISSEGSLEDAAGTGRLLGIRVDTVPIAPAVEALRSMLAGAFAGREEDVTEENLQARARGTVLMAFSNKFGDLPLTTGNKSEMSVGYATLYGDMNGGFSVLKDVYKTDVYRLARWRNGGRPAGLLGPEGPAVPEASITKPPSAELRPGQTDQDSLPDYEVLDAVLGRLVEEERSVDEVAAEGFERGLVERIRTLLFRAEYKRRQAPPGVRLTTRAFGRDRRYPITNAFVPETDGAPPRDP